MSNLENLLSKEDINNAKERQEFTPLPNGEYTIIIDSSEVKKTKDETGAYVSLTLYVMDGEHKGRLLWTNCNIINKNTVAAEIGKKTLALIAKCCGIHDLKDSSQLHNIPLVAVVVCVEDAYKGGLKNEVKSFKTFVTKNETKQETKTFAMPVSTTPKPAFTGKVPF